ncbi:hypothetical protein B0H16DRAFT_1764291 [Mycena metata]|uniref:Uncharacterized protein n=1 Tax=Mycena metata TaxID=1033252 RepID=A0AAD7I6B9_9AGAR|nr:hypothetical protein B0H16DRAFT_1764291 [Mycena metata]
MMIVLKLLCASKPKLQLLTTVIFCGRSEAAPVPPVTVLPAKAQSAVFRSDTGSIHSSCRRCFVWFTIFVVKEMGHRHKNEPPFKQRNANEQISSDNFKQTSSTVPQGIGASLAR